MSEKPLATNQMGPIPAIAHAPVPIVDTQPLLPLQPGEISLSSLEARIIELEKKTAHLPASVSAVMERASWVCRIATRRPPEGSR